MIAVVQCIEEARANEDIVALYEDELTFYQNPSIANGWEEKGKKQPLARLSQKGNKTCRIGGVLDISDGSVIFEQRSKIGVDELIILFERTYKKYISARKTYIIMDNWPIHKHPKVLQFIESTNIEFIFIPTYAPWTNAIEKLWRLLNQNVLHLHNHSDDWKFLKCMVYNFLKKFENGSKELLRYVGLSNGNIPSGNHILKNSKIKDKIPKPQENNVFNILKLSERLPI